MDVQAFEAPAYSRRSPLFAQIRWASVFAGTVVGAAAYLLMSLLGIAIGLSSVDAQGGGGSGAAIVAAIWTALSLLIAAYAGGYVAARMSGLSRRSDGMLHGLVAWGTTTVLFFWLATTTIGNLLGGTLTAVSQGVGAAAQGGGDQISAIIGSTTGARVTPDTLSALTERLQAGDRAGAVGIMTDQMGLAPDRANALADRLMPLMGPGGGQQLDQAADRAVTSLTAASWSLFFALLLALLFGIWGGAGGARTVARRATEDHSDERYLRTYP